MTEPISLLNTTFNLTNIHGVKLRITTFLSPENDKDFFINICGYNTRGSLYKFKSNKSLVTDLVHTKITHTFLEEQEENYKALTKEEIDENIKYLFSKPNNYYICCSCDEGYYCELYKGKSKDFQCNSCIAKKIYLNKNKSHEDVKICYLCDNLELKGDCILNSNCCFKKEVNEKYLCMTCFEKLNAEEYADDDNILTGEIFIRCPLCRGKLATEF